MAPQKRENPQELRVFPHGVRALQFGNDVTQQLFQEDFAL
jgi:hypothetical protein